MLIRATYVGEETNCFLPNKIYELHIREGYSFCENIILVSLIDQPCQLHEYYSITDFLDSWNNIQTFN